MWVHGTNLSYETDFWKKDRLFFLISRAKNQSVADETAKKKVKKKTLKKNSQCGIERKQQRTLNHDTCEHCLCFHNVFTEQISLQHYSLCSERNVIYSRSRAFFVSVYYGNKTQQLAPKSPILFQSWWKGISVFFKTRPEVSKKNGGRWSKDLMGGGFTEQNLKTFYLHSATFFIVECEHTSKKRSVSPTATADENRLTIQDEIYWQCKILFW